MTASGRRAAQVKNTTLHKAAQLHAMTLKARLRGEIQRAVESCSRAIGDIR
jgi:hypothetical protein